MNQLLVTVINKKIEAVGIVSLELADENGNHLPDFTAGAHIDVHLPDGIVRQYSLLNDSTENHRYVIAVLKDDKSRGGSVAIHEKIKVGDVLKVSTPKNHFPLTNASRSLLFAGGIGVTPILSMAHQLNHTKAAFEMHYCSRSRERTAFLETIQSSKFSEHVHFHFDDGDDIQKLDIFRLVANPSPTTHLYVCGPTGFINYVVNSAKEAGWQNDQIHFEYFGAEGVDTSNDKVFQVKIASSGVILDVAPEKSITRVLEENGVFVPVSCEEGVCGTCLTRVIEGEPDHRDLYLTDTEKTANNQILPCCSRAKSGMLTLDL